MRGYHHTVMPIATPFGDFTNWCCCGSISHMSKKDADAALRRKNLQRWIDGKYGGNKSAAARAADKPPTQFTDMINNPKRSFGAKLAREIEEKFKSLGMPKYYLDTNEGEIQLPLSRNTEDGWPFNFSRDEFDRLTEDQKEKIGYWVQGRIAGFMDEVPNSARTKRLRSNGAKS